MTVKVWHLLALVGAVVAGVGLLVGGTGGRGVAVAVGVLALATWILDQPASPPRSPEQRHE